MKRRFSYRFAACAVFLCCALGCEDKQTGPKRDDHEAAHSSRYHPDIARRELAASDGVKTPATQPVAAKAKSDTFPFAPAAGPVGCPVLFVNSQTITVKEILEPIIQELKTEAASLSLQGYVASVRGKIAQELERQISTLVIYEEAKKETPEKINELIEKEADRQIKNIINERFDGVHARYEAHLKALQLSLDDVKQRVIRRIMVQQFLHKRFQPMLQEPSRRELMKYYQSHLNELTTPQKVELFLIEIPLTVELDKTLSKASPAQIEAARRRATQKLQRAQEELASGIDFATVARHYSKGIYRHRGGAWGEIDPASLTQRWAKLAEILLTLKENQISGIVQSPESVFIVKCGKRTPAHQQAFEEAQEAIRNRLKDEQFDRMSSTYISSLLKRATIRKRSEFLRAVAAAAPRPPVRELDVDNASTISN